jgi:hypothetical protein
MFRRIFGPGPEHEQAADQAEAALTAASTTAGETATVRRIVARLEEMPVEQARLVASAAYTLARAAQADLDISAEETAVMEREPQARYRSAGDLAVDLEHWVEGLPILARRVSPPVRAWRWSKRNPKLAAATAAAVCSAMAAVFLLFSHNGLQPEPRLSQQAQFPKRASLCCRSRT